MSVADVESSAEAADALASRRRDASLPGPARAMSTEGPDIRVVSRGTTPHDVAAATAVLRGVLEEESVHLEEHPSHPSAWQRSQRPVRTPLTPGPGRWRGFTG